MRTGIVSAAVTGASDELVSLDCSVLLIVGSVGFTVVLFTGMLLPAGFVEDEVSADVVVWPNVVASPGTNRSPCTVVDCTAAGLVVIAAFASVLSLRATVSSGATDTSDCDVISSAVVDALVCILSVDMLVLTDVVTSPGTIFVAIVVVDDCSVVGLVLVPGVEVVVPLAGLVCTDADIDCDMCTVSGAEVVISSFNDMVVLAVPDLDAPSDVVTCTERVDDTMLSSG